LGFLPFLFPGSGSGYSWSSGSLLLVRSLVSVGLPLPVDLLRGHNGYNPQYGRIIPGFEPDSWWAWFRVSLIISAGCSHLGLESSVLVSLFGLAVCAGWSVVMVWAMPPRMVLLRHGETEWSRSGQHTGRTDIPLLDEGRTQAEAAGRAIRGLEPAGFAQVLHSPMRRASETCALAGFRGEVDQDLVEWEYGAYEGLTSAQIRRERPGWSLWDEGVPDGELCAEVGRRADRIIARALGADGDTLAVAHGHLLRVLAARWLGVPPAAGRWFRLRAGAVSVLGWETDWPAIEMWNLCVSWVRRRRAG
jgi:broad specificity phosphatase PhoE